MKIKEGFHWVGVVDWDLRHFHGHELSTHRGSTYNSYLIQDEKTVLIDTVWEPFAEDFVSNLKATVNLKEIDYVIINHGEPDHSGALPLLMEEIPNVTIVVTPKGKESLYRHYHQEWNFMVVRSGDRLNIGRRELVFFEAPMLHWPDTMFTYVEGDQILFSTDAFGMHYASSELFDDRGDADEILQEAVKYYANILAPFSHQVLRKLEEFFSLQYPLDMICPSHGVIWRDNPQGIIDLYYRWARGQGEERVVIFYDSMWEGTTRMARAMAQGLAEQGMPYKMCNVSISDRNDVITEAFLARGFLLGSPTFNRSYLPTVAPFLEELIGLRLQNKVGAAFGAYGWSGEAVGALEEKMEAAGIAVLQEGIRCKFRPTTQELRDCQEFAQRFARTIQES